MTIKVQRFGRAALVRSLLYTLPAGATAEQLIATGRLDCSHKQLSNSLGAMCDSGQVRISTTTGNKVWFLTDAMLKLMRTPDATVPPTRTPVECVMRGVPTGSNNSTTVLHRDRERLALAAQIAAFCLNGGTIQVLGNTPFRRELSRRQINDASGDARRTRNAKGDVAA